MPVASKKAPVIRITILKLLCEKNGTTSKAIARSPWIVNHIFPLSSISFTIGGFDAHPCTALPGQVSKSSRASWLDPLLLAFKRSLFTGVYKLCIPNDEFLNKFIIITYNSPFISS